MSHTIAGNTFGIKYDNFLLFIFTIFMYTFLMIFILILLKVKQSSNIVSGGDNIIFFFLGLVSWIAGSSAWETIFLEIMFHKKQFIFQI